MSYPPSYPGYPPGPSGPPPSNRYPPSAGGGGIGFESLMNPPPPSQNYGQPAAFPMPSPNFGAPAPQQYGVPPRMPMAAPAHNMPVPVASSYTRFGGAANLAHAAMAFQAPVQGHNMPTPNYTGYNAPAAPYAAAPYAAAPYAGNNNSIKFPAATAPVQPSVPTPTHDHRHSSKSTHPSPSATTAAQSLTSRNVHLATVKPSTSFNAQVDAETIKKAIGGFGTNVKEIINVLSTRTNSERLKIALEYKSQFGRDLRTDLQYALGGSLENLLLAMMQSPAEYDASELRKAMKGLGTKESVLIEILCSRTNAEIAALKLVYKKKFDRDLEKDVHSETSGHFRKFLTSLTQANRDETTNVDHGKARSDADALYKAGEKRWGTDESRFNVIFASRSFAQLRATFNEYAKISKYDIEKSVEREMSGDLKNAMITLVQCVRNTPAYFALKLYKSMKGLGTDDATLIRILVTRCEVDMVIIKQEFQKLYQKTLADFIKGDTSGNYRKTLLGLIGEREK